MLDFYKNAASRDGLQDWCRSCQAEHKRSPVGKASERKWNRSPKGKVSRKKYQQTNKGRATGERWRQSDVGKASRKKQRLSLKGKASRKRYRVVHKEKIAEKEKVRRQMPINKATKKRGSDKYRKDFPERVKANRATNNAIKTGELERPSFCESCNKEAFTIGHHESYEEENWLVVDWLCASCHVELHRLLRLLPEITQERLLKLMQQRLPIS